MAFRTFPKRQSAKRRKKHKKSLMPYPKGTCYLCLRLENNARTYPITHEHHVYGGPNRAVSEAEGFKVRLCPRHHEFGDEAVHRNISNMRLIQKDMQQAYEKTHSRTEFMRLIGRNYLEE